MILPLGNLVADAFQFITSTDIALQAGGSIALPMWEGTFTAGDLFRANGYGFNDDKHTWLSTCNF